MAKRVHPTRIDADNSSGSFAAVCSDWRIGDADSFGATGRIRSHLRCRIYDCRYFPNSQTIDQALAVWGESIYAVLGIFPLKETNRIKDVVMPSFCDAETLFMCKSM